MPMFGESRNADSGAGDAERLGGFIGAHSAPVHSNCDPHGTRLTILQNLESAVEMKRINPSDANFLGRQADYPALPRIKHFAEWNRDKLLLDIAGRGRQRQKREPYGTLDFKLRRNR